MFFCLFVSLAVSGMNCKNKFNFTLLYLNVKFEKGLRRLLSWDFPGSPVIKKPPANARHMGSIPGWERFHMLGATKPVHHNYSAYKRLATTRGATAMRSPHTTKE